MTQELKRLIRAATDITSRYTFSLDQPTHVFSSREEKGDMDMGVIKQLLAELTPEKWSNLTVDETQVLNETRSSLQKFLDAFYAYIAAYATFYKRIDELREAMQYSRDQLYAFNEAFGY